MDPGYHKRRHETLEYFSWEHSSSMSVWIRGERVSLVSRYCDSPEDLPSIGVTIGVLGSSLFFMEHLVTFSTYFAENQYLYHPYGVCHTVAQLEWYLGVPLFGQAEKTKACLLPAIVYPQLLFEF